MLIIFKCNEVVCQLPRIEILRPTMHHDLEGLQLYQQLKLLIMLYNLILASWQISVKSIAKVQEISWECIEFIIHDQLNLQMLSAKWMPKCLNANQKWYQVESTKLILQYLQQSGDYLLQIPCHCWWNIVMPHSIQKPKVYESWKQLDAIG